MNLLDARTLAMELMRQHGLAGWTFAFDHARRRFGCCNYTKKRISLSRPLTLLNGEEEVRDTLLHEIAHALTPGDGHGRRWKAACVRIGAKPRRCYREHEVVSPPRGEARYRIGCRACGWWRERRRVTRARYLCKTCRGPVVYHDRPSGRVFQIGTDGRAVVLSA